MKKSTSPQARLHALYYPAENNAGWWTYGSLEEFLKDPHPAMRKHSIVILERGYSLQADDELLDGSGEGPRCSGSPATRLFVG